MADIGIAIVAKNEATSAIAKVNADLAGLAQQAQETGNAFVSIGKVQLSLGTGTTAIKDLAQDIRNATEGAKQLGTTLSESTKIRNAGGVETISAGVRQAEAELQGLLKTFQQLAKEGKLDFGEGTAANLSKVQATIGQQLAALKAVEAASKDARKAGILGDGASAARQINEATRTSQLLTQTLKTVEGQAGKTGKAVSGIGGGGALAGIKNEVAGLDRAFGSLGNAVSGNALGVAAGAIGFGATAVAIGQIGSAITDAVQAAGQLDKLRNSFDQLSSQAGQSSEEILSTLRSASFGMVKDSDLILSANKAMLLGVADTGEELGALLNVARVRGQAMGLDVTTAFNDIVVGLGRLSPRILDNLGIVVDETKVYGEFAATLSKTAAQLTENEKRQALLNAVIERSASLTAKAPTGAGAAIAQAGVAPANAQVATGEFFAPAVRDSAQAYGDAIALAQGKLDLAARAQRELNDAIADGELLTQDHGIVKLDAADIAGMQELSAAMAEADKAQAAGVPNARLHAEALDALNASALATGHITTEMAAGIALERAGLAENTEQWKLYTAAQKQAAAAQGLQRSGAFFNDQAEALERTTRAAFQASDEVKKLSQSLSVAEKIAVAGTSSLNEFNAALRRIKGQDAIKSQVQGLRDSALGKARSVVQQGVDSGRLSVEDGAAQYNKLATAINSVNAPVDTTITNMFRFENQLDSTTAGTERANDAFDKQNEAAKRLAEEGLQAIKEQYDDIVSKVGSVIGEAQKLPSFKAHQLFNAEELKTRGLTGDSQVSVDQAVDGSKNRPDAINENARRLMAIAVEGFKDQPWLEEFKREVPEIFKELESNPDIRGTGLRILQQFEAGLRPELLDTSAIKDRVKQMILGDQNAAALAEQIANEIATEMGISLPQALAASKEALGVGPAEGAGGADIAAPDLTTQGTVAGESFRAGMVAGFDAAGMSGAILVKIDAEFSNPKSVDAIKKSGGAVGAVWGAGFMATVGDNVPAQLLEMLVTKLLPAILAGINVSRGQTGATP